jgi:hypothetical protein
MVSAELKPVTRTFGTTVVKNDALAAYATHATHQITTTIIGIMTTTMASTSIIYDR